MKTKKPLRSATSLLCGLISMGLAPLGGAYNSAAKTPVDNICSPIDDGALVCYSGNQSAGTEPDPVPEPQCTALLAALLVALALMLRRKRDLVV